MSRTLLRRLIPCILVLAGLGGQASGRESSAGFSLPEPGSYQLPVIGLAGEGEVVTPQGQATTLHQLMGDRVVLLSFIYATCSDERGCPLATRVLQRVARQIEQDSELRDGLRLLTLSFDPVHDTPTRLQQYARRFGGLSDHWQFLTTGDERRLQPILTAYQQRVEKMKDGSFSHLLRVYLIDRDRRIRNIYSADMLDPDLLLTDVKTLLHPGLAAKPARPVDPGGFRRPGDDRTAYEGSDFRSHSAALSERRGQAAALFDLARQAPLGLPPVPVPADSPLTPERIGLGRKLFYDRRLSFNDTVSCALCHIPEQGFSSNEMATATGMEGRSVRRNSPTLFNVGHARLLFHDGRENRLEQQVWGPLLASNEMANPSVGYVVEKLGTLPDYAGLFEQAFGRGPGMETIGMALASYQRTLNAADSPFDRWYFGKQSAALDPAARRGFRLFTGKAGCSRCHRIEPDYALFTDHLRHNTGTGYLETLQPDQTPKTLQVGPGLSIAIRPEALQGLRLEHPADLGYYEISRNPADRWVYKTPSLRNVALTAPYMHNGVFRTLEAVVDFYDQGGIANPNRSPLLAPLKLSSQERQALVAFLKSLTAPGVDVLVSDAFAAAIGDHH